MFYDHPMKSRICAPVLAVALVGVGVFGATQFAGFAINGPSVAEAQATYAAAPALGEELRYIGRDPVTGMPARVDDRFIAQVEEGIERYGLDEREAVPPPERKGEEPVLLRVPDLNVAHSTDRYGLDEFGRLDVPQDRSTIGWHPAYSDIPGEGGATFFAAHYEYQGIPGVFYTLSSLQPGSLVELELDDGSVHQYRVTSTIDYELGVIDMGALLLGREGTESVTLMTCSGPIRNGNYQERTVVLAERVS